jgi:hypothetical protein
MEALHGHQRGDIHIDHHIKGVYQGFLDQYLQKLTVILYG